MNILNNENEDPQFVLLSEKNKDEFLVWCLTKLWEDNLKINDEFLNYYMELKMKEWIEQYHPWLYCYTCIRDEFNLQKINQIHHLNYLCYDDVSSKYISI